MVSKGAIKFIKSLKIKKYREVEQRFLIEGSKSVLEAVRSDFEIEQILATSKFLDKHSAEVQNGDWAIQMASQQLLESIGVYKSNDSALAVAKMKSNHPLELVPGEYGLALDCINDPGNLGTLLRTADWYGISKVVCSRNTADLYNPKVIQSSMGSFTRVSVYYTNLKDYLSSQESTVYGAFMNGEDVHQVDFEGQGWVVLGSESSGINPELKPFINRQVTIPRFGNAESLNVSVAAGVICDNLRRSAG